MSEWEFEFSRQSLKFLKKNNITEDEVTGAVRLGIRRLSKELVNIDLKKLNPPYEGYYRVRVGKIRITFVPYFHRSTVEIAEVEWRGSAYK